MNFGAPKKRCSSDHGVLGRAKVLQSLVRGSFLILSGSFLRVKAYTGEGALRVEKGLRSEVALHHDCVRPFIAVRALVGGPVRASTVELCSQFAMLSISRTVLFSLAPRLSHR